MNKAQVPVSFVGNDFDPFLDSQTTEIEYDKKYIIVERANEYGCVWRIVRGRVEPFFNPKLSHSTVTNHLMRLTKTKIGSLMETESRVGVSHFMDSVRRYSSRNRRQ